MPITLRYRLYSRGSPSIAKKLNLPPLSVTSQHLRNLGDWGQIDIFQANMAHFFGRYRDALVKNKLTALSEASSAMTAGAFESIFGLPPWTQLNQTLLTFGLNYHVEAPDLNSYDNVVFELLKEQFSNEPVPVDRLSSGEKVLYQFAISSFVFDDSLFNISRPKLLLLDEMDASLHPEMVNHWIRAIKDVFG